MLRLCVALVALVAFLSGCEAATPRAVAPAGARPPSAGLDVAGILATTTRVRGLSPVGDVDVELLGESAFLDKARELEIEDPTFVLWDIPHHALFVRRDQQTDPRAARDLVVFFDGILVEDNFALLKKKVATVEASQLRLALLFADELLTAAGVDAARNGTSASRAIARVGAEHVDLTWDHARDWDANAQDVANVLARQFVGELYRTGGFPLVDAAYARFPLDSRAVVGAQAWLDGLEHVALDAQLPGPAPTSEVAKRNLGGLSLVSLALAGGADDATARALGAGLRYAALESIAKGDTTEPLRLVLVFDREAQAKQMEDLMTDKSQSASGPAAGPLPKDGGRVSSNGKVVAVAWGGDGATVEDVSHRLGAALNAVATPAPRDPPPFGALRVAPPLPAAPDLRLAPNVRGDAVDVPLLGLTLTAPFTFHPQASKPPMLASFVADDGGNLLVSAFSSWSPTSTADEFLRGLKKHGPAREVPAGPPLAGYRRWDFELGKVHLMLLTRPLCDAGATLMIAATMIDPAGIPFARDWITKLDLSRIEGGAYCASIVEEKRELTFPALPR
jgi:hypothetical protein